MNNDKAAAANELFRSGFNCAQSVLGAFCEDFGVDIQTGLKAAGAFGSGMRCGEVCGAVSGALMVIGLKYGHSQASDTESKSLCNSKTREFMENFKNRNGSYMCRDILKCDISTPGGAEYARENGLFRTVCAQMIEDAANILCNDRQE